MMDAEGRPTGLLPTVNIPPDGCAPGTRPLAMIHSHVSGSGVPSISDVSWIPSINFARGDAAGRVYVVSYDGSSYRINVYNSGNAESASASGAHGPEVNPNGLPCSPSQVI
jgi:hypothetical protein